MDLLDARVETLGITQETHESLFKISREETEQILSLPPITLSTIVGLPFAFAGTPEVRYMTCLRSSSASCHSEWLELQVPRALARYTGRKGW